MDALSTAPIYTCISYAAVAVLNYQWNQWSHAPTINFCPTLLHISLGKHTIRYQGIFLIILPNILTEVGLLSSLKFCSLYTGRFTGGPPSTVANVSLSTRFCCTLWGGIQCNYIFTVTGIGG